MYLYIESGPAYLKVSSEEQRDVLSRHCSVVRNAGKWNILWSLLLYHQKYQKLREVLQ